MAVILFDACRKHKPEPEKQADSSVMQPIGTSRNEQVVKDFFSAFNAHNWDLATSYYVDSAIFLDPSISASYVKMSRNQVKQKYVELQTAASDVKDSVVSMYSVNNVVVVQFISTGTFGGFIARSPICTVFTLNDSNKISVDATYYDK